MPYLLELTARAEPHHFWYHGFRASVRPVLQAIARGRRDLRIIDCGCGTGYNLRHLLAPYGNTFGFDLSSDAMLRARGSGRPIVKASVEQIPFASNTFDLATSFDVIQSVPDDVKALAEPVFAHRLIVQPSARVKGANPAAIVAEILRTVPVPDSRIPA